jgi:hypothetical protein
MSADFIACGFNGRQLTRRAMMDYFWWIGLGTAAGLVVLVLAWRPVRDTFREIQDDKARERFSLQREHLEAKFIDLAAASGKPRGLRWKDCDFENAVSFARDKATGKLAALVAVNISFEAVEGGDMEGIAAVANLRNASAVFFFDRGQWHTAGKAIFNLNPDEAIARFEGQYERVEMV